MCSLGLKGGTLALYKTFENDRFCWDFFGDKRFFFLEFKILIFSVVPDNKVEAGMYFSSWNVWLYKNGQFPDLQKYFILLKHCYIMQIVGLFHFPEYTFMKMNQIPSESLVYNNCATSKTG